MRRLVCLLPVPAFCCAALGPDAVQAILQHYPTPLHLHRAYKVLRLGFTCCSCGDCVVCCICGASIDTPTPALLACRRRQRQRSAVARTGSAQRSASCTASSPRGELLPALYLRHAACGLQKPSHPQAPLRCSLLLLT